MDLHTQSSMSTSRSSTHKAHQATASRGATGEATARAAWPASTEQEDTRSHGAVMSARVGQCLCEASALQGHGQQGHASAERHMNIVGDRRGKQWLRETPTMLGHGWPGLQMEERRGGCGMALNQRRRAAQGTPPPSAFVSCHERGRRGSTAATAPHGGDDAVRRGSNTHM